MSDYYIEVADEYDRLLRRMRTDIYRLTVRPGTDDDDDEGTAGVREPRRPKPLIPAMSLAREA